MTRARHIRIGVDASSTVGPRTGVGNATAGLLNALPNAMPEGWQLVAWVNSPRHPIPGDPWTRDTRVTVRQTRWPGKVLLTAWRRLSSPSIRSFAGPLSLFHSAGGYPIPASSIRRIISVHDLYFLQRPADEDPWGGGYFRATYPSRLADHDRLICFSQETAKDILDVYGIGSDRISIIPHGVDHHRFKPEGGPGELERLSVWTKGEPYFLTVGTIGRRKNIEALVEAWSAAAQDSSFPRLVIVGHRTGGENLTDLERMIAASGQGGRIAWTGYVPDEDVAALYRHALAFAFPSVKEGFGLPVLEAMACGCPVVCSDLGAVGEVAGSAAHRIDVTSVLELQKELARLAGDKAMRTRLRTSGLRRAADFTWEHSARLTVDAYRQVLDA